MSIYKQNQYYYSLDGDTTGGEDTTATDPKTTPNDGATGQDTTPNFEDSKDFKEMKKILKTQAQELAKFKDAEKLKTEEELKSKGEFEKLSALKDAEIAKYKADMQTATYSNKATQELIKQGVNQDFIDLVIPSVVSQLKSNNDGEIENLTETIANLKQSRPSLFSVTPSVPAGTTGGQNSGAGQSSGLSADQLQKIADSGDANLINKHSEDFRKLSQNKF